MTCFHGSLLASTSSSWLASLPSSCSHSNQQIVPRLRVCHSTSNSIQYTLESSFQQAAASVARPAAYSAPAAAAAAVLAATGHHGSLFAADADDPNTIRARLYALYDFVAANGRLPSMQDTQQGVAVGQWAEKCKQHQQENDLEPALAAALQSIPGWTWDVHVTTVSATFEQMLQQLVAYSKQYGTPPQRNSKRTAAGSSSNSNSSSSSNGKAGPSQAEYEAAIAVSKQLMDQRRRGVLTRQQMDAVVDFVPGWRWHSRIRTPALDELITILQDFHQKHGHLPKADQKTEDGFHISEWCMARRGEHSRGELESDVAALLETQVPGWMWDRLENVFEKNLEALAGFVAANGRTPTQRDEYDGVRVGAWCNKRRLQYKAGNLAADRVAALEAIPGWWWNCDQMPEDA